MKILIAEDDRELNRSIKERLYSENFIVDCCYTGEEALDFINNAEYDAVILDVMLPKKSGMDVLIELRERDDQVPVLAISSRGETEDIVQGLDNGADDYMVKPFSYQELLARLRRILRRPAGIRSNIYRCADLELNIKDRTVSRDGAEIHLSPREFSILFYLIRHQGIVVTRQQILDNIYSIDQDLNSNVIDVYIRLLRKKIDENSDNRLIHTIRGSGYIMKSTR